MSNFSGTETARQINSFHSPGGPFDLPIFGVCSRRVNFGSKMIELTIIIFLAVCLILLVRRGLIQADLSMPWLLALIVFGLLSTNDGFVNWVGITLGNLYPPNAVIFIIITILLGLITVLLIAVTRLRQRQMIIARRLAKLELALQDTPSFHSERSDI